MGQSIESVKIDTFRGLHSFELENLAQINILTGDNNSGKTSVLELLSSLEDPTSFITWRKLLRDSRDGFSIYDGFYNLFDINSDNKKIIYSIESNGEIIDVTISAKEEQEEVTEREFYKKQGLQLMREDKKYDEIIREISILDMQIEVNGKKTDQLYLYEGQKAFPYMKEKRTDYLLEDFHKNVVFVSPFHHTEGTLFLSAILDEPELYEEMLTVLKEFDEDIISINLDSQRDDKLGRKTYKILSRSHKKALPLNVYGDGMKKAILLMSAVIKAKNGILLLDEFETAIHTSAMDRTFRWILETCVKLNVQVFLTSHSKEAIDKVLRISKELREKMAVYTLYYDKDGSSVRRLEGEKALEVQDEMGLELR